MGKLREIAWLRYAAGRTLEEFANAVGVARSSVQLTLQRLPATRHCAKMDRDLALAQIA